MNLLNYLKKTNYTDTDIDTIRQRFATMGVNVDYDNGKMFRAIFSPQYKGIHDMQFKNLSGVLNECNGTIVGFDKSVSPPAWRLLAKPPNVLHTKINSREANRLIIMKKYTIYKVKEGTIVTLYSTPGGWSMSSRFGMDVTDYTWDGISYIDAIRDILREKKIDEKKFFESLDAKRSYTIGFRHPKRHPFKPSYDIWFVQSCDLENGQVYAKNSDAPTGLSFHEEVVTSSIYELFKNATKSLNDVLTGEANEPNFGYILKGIGCRNLLIESRLLQEISKLYYSKIHMKTAKEYKMDRVKYVVLRSFLTKSINKTFITLFPQFEPEFAELRKVSNKILHHIGCSTESELPRDLDNDKFIAYANQIKANLAQKITKHNPALYSRYAAEYLINPIHIPLYANLYKFKHPVNSHSESGPDKVTISDYLPSTISS